MRLSKRDLESVRSAPQHAPCYDSVTAAVGLIWACTLRVVDSQRYPASASPEGERVDSNLVQAECWHRTASFARRCDVRPPNRTPPTQITKS